MSIIKVAKDFLIKGLNGSRFVPKELLELNEYFRHYGPIKFNFTKENGLIVAVSIGFRYGSIITSGKDEDELDRNIKDAILTSFSIPSSYAREAKISRVEERRTEYVLA